MNTDKSLGLQYGVTAAVAVGVSIFVTVKLIQRLRKKEDGPINPSIRKDEKKVGDVLDIDDLMSQLKPGEKVSLCRCWRSKKWPYCDGAHKAHNQSTGDNVGPVNIKKAPAH